ncbi:hypothetical protein GCM10028799_81880 [Kribbella italica]
MLVVVAVLFALSAPVVLAAPAPAAAGVRETAADDPPTTTPTPPPVPVDEPVFGEPSSSKVTLSRGNSTVSVSRTGGLTRQMLNVSWTGMTPSEANSFPVAVMQCRGSNPKREDCWMSDQLGYFVGYYRGSSYLPVETSKWAAFPGGEFGTLYSQPFKKADGSYHIQPNPDAPGGYNGTGLNDKLTDSTVDDYTPGTGNQRDGRTRPNGTGEVQTWANTRTENPSLGCDEKTPCSIVVVPITQHPCREGLGELELLFCQSDYDFKTDAVLASWPLLANWYQRYVFKLSFAPAAATCLGRDDSAKFLGSELVGEAMRRWVPARCPKSSPSALDFTRGWEPDSRRQFGQTDPIAPSGYEADAAMVSEPTPADETVVEKRKPAYAPVAVSGFAIGYNWERSEAFGGGPVPEIKLNARLVAKLLTQSYPGKYRAGNDFPVNPNAGTNPPNLAVDPEFQQLNPDAKNWVGLNDAVGTQIAVPVFKSDVLLAVTRWIWSDPAARGFVQGKADPWGMTVNKTYKGWSMPRDDYQLNDGWLLPKDQNEWSNFSPQALGAQSSNSWVQGADVLMTAWPLSQSPVPPLQVGLPTVPKRVDAQVPGQRSLMALTTTSELAKSGMPAVKLQNFQGAYVGPDTDSMMYALDNATVDGASGIWRVNHQKMEQRGYPGTMVTYAQVPTATLKPAEATRYADALRWMATEGQLYGQEAGQLPEGYLSLPDPMRDQAMKVAAAVENQTGAPPVPPKNEDPLPEGDDDPTPDQPTDKPSAGQNGGGGGGQNGNGGGNGGDSKTQPNGSATKPVPLPSVTPSKGTVQANGELKPVVAETQGDSLGWLAWGIPALLAAGLAAGVASPGIRLIAQPGHPVRRGFAAGGSYLAGFVRRRRRHG